MMLVVEFVLGHKLYCFNIQGQISEHVVVPNGVAVETLSGVFDISSQLKQKLRSKRRSKIIEICAN